MRAITRKGKGLARYGAIISQDILSDFQSPSKKLQLEYEQHCKFGAGQSPEEGCHDSYLARTGRNRVTVVLLFCLPFSGPSRISLISAFLFESKLKMLKPLPKSHFFRGPIPRAPETLSSQGLRLREHLQPKRAVPCSQHLQLLSTSESSGPTATMPKVTSAQL